MSPPVTWNAVSPSSQAMTMMAPMSASMSLLRRRTCILAGRRARQPAARAVGRTTFLRRPPVLGAAHGALHSRSRRVLALGVASAPQSGGEARGDPDFRRQRPVDRTAVRDLQQALALHLVERTVQNDLALDGIERPVLGLTVGAVVRMDLLVAQADLDVSEGPAPVLRVHSQRDRGARAQRGEQ